METHHGQFYCGVSHSLYTDTLGRRPLKLATIMATRSFHGDLDVYGALVCSTGFD